jgi:hypothetical protein
VSFVLGLVARKQVIKRRKGGEHAPIERCEGGAIGGVSAGDVQSSAGWALDVVKRIRLVQGCCEPLDVDRNCGDCDQPPSLRKDSTFSPKRFFLWFECHLQQPSDPHRERVPHQELKQAFPCALVSSRKVAVRVRVEKEALQNQRSLLQCER